MADFGLTDDERKRILLDGEQMCGPAISLGKVLDLLVAANMHEEDEGEYDEARLDAQASAKVALFQLATGRTNGGDRG